jgi:1,4-dihydroxy-2-naphthoate octaprenyltransferase
MMTVHMNEQMSGHPRWKTLSPKDPEFISYLDGSFSSEYIAIPVRSLNVGSASEQVTFEIRAVSGIQRPSLVKTTVQLMRLPSLVFSVSPMMAVLFYCRAHGIEIHSGIAISSFVGILLFHVAVNLLNDYGDHMKGQDRLRPHGGSRAIQNGWVRAKTLRSTAWVLLGLAFLCGLPPVILHFQPVFIAAGLAFLVALEFAFQRFRLKARGWAEFLAFLLTGPLLTGGYAWAISGTASLREFFLGAIFGSISLLFYHSANFENIMSDSQAGAVTWATRAGFDASKTFYRFVTVLVVVCSLTYVFYFERDLRFVPVLLAQILFIFPLWVRVRNLASPLSSGLVGLRSESVRLCLITLMALVGGYLWMGVA